MKKYLCLLFLLISGISLFGQDIIRKAPAPLFRDPIYDGAADPVLVYNREAKEWTMLYTQRRANQQSQDVSFCYGTAIGVATTMDHGQTWVYRGTLDLAFEKGMNTFWAPEVIYENGIYHLFVTYIQGVYTHWGGNARLVHYTSKNLSEWKFKGGLKLSENVIDPTLMKLGDDKWHIWYKGANSNTMTAESSDLVNWKSNPEPAIAGPPHEGPKIFKFKNYFWMITDEWHGQRVYRSEDAKKWEKQGLILDYASNRPDDSPVGAHADVVVVNDHVYIFYFTHPGRKTHSDDGGHDKDDNLSYSAKRSSIQVAELEFGNGTLTCNREKPFDFWLP